MWTEADLQTLRDRYEAEGAVGLMAVLDRSAESIRKTANRMGLRNRTNRPANSPATRPVVVKPQQRPRSAGITRPKEEVERLVLEHARYVSTVANSFSDEASRLIGGKDEVRQLAFVRLFFAAQKWNPAKFAEFRVYALLEMRAAVLTAIHKELGRDRINHARTVNTGLWFDGFPQIARESQAGIDSECSEIIRKAISQLTTIQADVVQAIFLRGERNTEIAKRLGLSLKSIKMISDEALARLRELLSDWEDA